MSLIAPRGSHPTIRASSKGTRAAPPPRLSRFFAFDVIDENAPHGVRRQGIEVRAVLLINIDVDEPQIRLMNKCRRGQRVIAPFRGEALRGQAARR